MTFVLIDFSKGIIKKKTLVMLSLLILTGLNRVQVQILFIIIAEREVRIGNLTLNKMFFSDLRTSLVTNLIVFWLGSSLNLCSPKHYRSLDISWVIRVFSNVSKHILVVFLSLSTKYWLFIIRELWVITIERKTLSLISKRPISSWWHYLLKLSLLNYSKIHPIEICPSDKDLVFLWRECFKFDQAIIFLINLLKKL